jgi:hypothetical protein
MGKHFPFPINNFLIHQKYLFIIVYDCGSKTNSVYILMKNLVTLS